jgi:thiol-disulfide isomerase/thioredoxin
LQIDSAAWRRIETLAQPILQAAILRGMFMFRRIRLYLVCIVLLAACGAEPAPPSTTGVNPDLLIATSSKLLDTSGATTLPEVGEVAPNFQYTFEDGTTTKLSDLQGKKVIVNFWATWCVPCEKEMPALQQAGQEYGDSVVVIGVNRDEEAPAIRAFAEELGVQFPLIANPERDISQRYRANNLPTTYFINTDGSIGSQRVGEMDYAFIKQQLDQLK